MNISLETVQDLAPDQASLNAAKKLLKPAKWPLLGQAASVNTIWGECQGSGSKPYYTMADVVDHGYKCTCPSRKFPCKHVLALLWQFSDDTAHFAESEPPQWVIDWLSRRRRPSEAAGSNTANSDVKNLIKKNIHGTEPDQQPVSAEALAKKAAAQAKRAAQNKAKTDASVTAGLLEFQQWLDDQLVNGISTFIKEINSRCRHIASRLVDAKASHFASRIDQLPAKIVSLPSPSQPEAVYRELGKLALLSEAWLRNGDDVDTRRAVVTSETRDHVINHPDAKRIHGVWETVGERVETRKDGLIAHARWLLRIDGEASQPALLLDYYPAATGRREIIASVGRKIEGELIFYPARIPTRALLGEHKAFEATPPQPVIPTEDYEQCVQQQLRHYPWCEAFPCVLGEGRVLTDKQGHYWWASHCGTLQLPLKNEGINPILLGSDLTRAFIVSDGVDAELMSATTAVWGTVAC